jgi:hypothetical protein
MVMVGFRTCEGCKNCNSQRDTMKYCMLILRGSPVFNKTTFARKKYEHGVHWKFKIHIFVLWRQLTSGPIVHPQVINHSG